MHPLDNVTTIIEYSPDVLRVDGACEMGITVVLAVAARRGDALQRERNVSARLSILSLSRARDDGRWRD